MNWINWNHSEYTSVNSCRCADSPVADTCQVFIGGGCQCCYCIWDVYYNVSGELIRFGWLRKLPEPNCHPQVGGSTFLWHVQASILHAEIACGGIWANKTSFNPLCGSDTLVCWSNSLSFLRNCERKLNNCHIPELSPFLIFVGSSLSRTGHILCFFLVMTLRCACASCSIFVIFFLSVLEPFLSCKRSHRILN